MNHEHSPTGDSFAIPDEETGQLGVPVAVVDGFFYQLHGHRSPGFGRSEERMAAHE
jgi:hypothetical protein